MARPFFLYVHQISLSSNMLPPLLVSKQLWKVVSHLALKNYIVHTQASCRNSMETRLACVPYLEHIEMPKMLIHHFLSVGYEVKFLLLLGMVVHVLSHVFIFILFFCVTAATPDVTCKDILPWSLSMWMYVCMHVCMRASVYACICVCMHLCVCVYVVICVTYFWYIYI